MKETFILRTSELWTSRGVVHIRTIGYDQDEETYIEYDAQALLDDIPSLYRMAKQAIEQQNEYETKKFVDFRNQLKEDYKGKRGRKRQ
jgi:hypothetical protein